MHLAIYACNPDNSKGRLIKEQSASTRNVFQRDRDRIIHSDAFRRLKYKTQVFVYHQGDHYRTRLTHTLEVAQIARSIARYLGFHEDLTEGVALAHDLGHPPFAHAGEEALDQCMKDYGGFDHNDQSLRIVTSLEMRYGDFDGLNLSWETLEGIVKHNGPLLPMKKGEALPLTIAEFQKDFDLKLNSYASGEAQIAALSDDIAYNNHDIEDGLISKLFHMDDLCTLPVVGDVVEEVQQKFGDIKYSRQVHELVRRLINLMITDVIEETQRRLKNLDPQSAEDIRQAGQAVVGFSGDMAAAIEQLREFLFHNMYRNYQVNRTMSKAKRVVKDLFRIFFEEPDTLPDEWQGFYHDKCLLADQERANKILKSSVRNKDYDVCKARVVLDYVAGMTDRYALEEHRKMFDPYSK